jgi:hypothetical protein
MLTQFMYFIGWMDAGELMDAGADPAQPQQQPRNANNSNIAHQPPMYSAAANHILPGVSLPIPPIV